MPSNLQAAMAYGQFKRIDELLKIKREIYLNYKREFKSYKVKFNNDNKKVKNGFWATVINFNKKYKVNIPKLIKSLEKKKIYSRSFFSPLSTQIGYKNFKIKNLKNRNALDLFNNSLVLPSHYNLNSKDIKFISDNIKKRISNN